MKNEFLLADIETAADLQAFLTRAKRLDPNGLVRLRAYGDVLAAYVAPIFAGSIMENGPTVLGLRTCALATPAEVESLVDIQSVLDRLARVIDADVWNAKGSTILLPENQRAPWAGITPPRSGWVELGEISEQELTQIAKDGIAEVADTLPESVGGPIAARIRGEIWGRAIEQNPRVPTGAAFVAAGLGFLTENENVAVYEAENWVRLSSMHGHVIARAATSFA
ncbi:MAG: hypothetical protein RIS80_127 [Actinomycetota bacterium]|jgi:hypothetical protein